MISTSFRFGSHEAAIITMQLFVEACLLVKYHFIRAVHQRICYAIKEFRC